MPEPEIANIPESFFEYKAEFRTPLFDWWQNPTQIVEALYQTLRGWNVNLGNAFFEKDPKTIRDVQVAWNVEKLASTIKVGYETASFSSFNPDWGMADQLLSLFDIVMSTIKSKGKAEL